MPQEPPMQDKIRPLTRMKDDELYEELLRRVAEQGCTLLREFSVHVTGAPFKELQDDETTFTELGIDERQKYLIIDGARRKAEETQLALRQRTGSGKLKSIHTVHEAVRYITGR